MTLDQALTLPCGSCIPNRLTKAAMTEGLAEPGGRVGERILRLYERWAEGGIGLQITGNMMVDGEHSQPPYRSSRSRDQQSEQSDHCGDSKKESVGTSESSHVVE